MSSAPELGSQTNPDLQVTGAPPQAQPSGQTITMFAPDGVTVGQIPQENMHAAIAAGGKLAVNFISPEGQQGYIPLDRVHDAIRAGGHINNAVINALTSTSDVPAIGQGFAKAAINTMRGAANTMGGEGMAEKVGIPNVDTEAHGGYEMTGKALETGLELAPAAAPIIEKAAGAVGAAKEAIPSAQHAAQALNELKQEVGNVPINVEKPASTAFEIWKQSERGADLPSTVRKLVTRLTDLEAEPMTYEEAKDFQSNISNLSASERMQVNANTGRLVGKLNAELKDALKEAADTEGQGQKFVDAMREYHRAMKIQGVKDEVASKAIKTLVYGLLGGAAARAGFDIYQAGK